MRKIICIIAALALTAWGCSSDDDEPTTPAKEAPADSAIVIQPGTATPPTWQMPDFSRFEQTMSLFLTLQPELVPYSSRQDLLCAIIGGEIRGVAPFDVDNNGFVLTIAGSSSDDNISLSYYCDSLHRIFTIPDWTTFDTDIRPMGKESVFTPIFVTRTDFTF
jgi:hypothetical protein